MSRLGLILLLFSFSAVGCAAIPIATSAPSLVPTATDVPLVESAGAIGPVPVGTSVPVTPTEERLSPTPTVVAVATLTPTPSLTATPTGIPPVSATPATMSPVCTFYAEGKAIIIDLSEQKLYACEDGQLVLETLVSTGDVRYPTPVGEYRIYLKLVADRMTGPGYDLPAVPWTMYFYGGYAIHGAYWHDEFGRVRSHGCVNVPTMECPSGWTCPAQEFAGGRDIAKELFDWAEPVLPEGAR